MTQRTKHRHGASGQYQDTPDADAAIDDLLLRVIDLENHTHPEYALATHTHGSTPPPDPDPDPVVRPFPAPTTTSTRTIPASGDINAYLAGIPDGCIVEVPATGSYGEILLPARHHLDIRGNGAKLTQTKAGNIQEATAILTKGSTDIRVGDFRILGNNPNTTNLFVPGSENSHASACGGWGGGAPSSNIEFYKLIASNIFGDLTYIEGRNVEGDRRPSHHVWVHDNEGYYIGRNGVSMINGTDVLVEWNDIDKIGMDALDLEPNFGVEQIKRIVFRDNQIGSYGHMSQQQGWFVNAWAFDATSVIEDIDILDNDVVGNPSGRYDGSIRALAVQFHEHAVIRRVKVEGNSTALPAPGPVMWFNGVEGVTIHNGSNTQPLTSGQLASIINCTGIVQ